MIARLTLFALLLSSLAVFACADGEGTVDPRTPGTLAMASRLAALAVPPDDVDGIGPGAGRAQAFAVAFQPNLVPQLRAQIASNDDPFQDLILRHRLAVQLMREGDTDASLTELETLLLELESFPVPLPPERKARMLAILMRTIGVTALRLGEQENCIAAHSAESCLFPIRGAGVHRHERGSRRAIEALTRQLEIEPTSIDARWLINLAYMTLGEYPDSVPPAYRLAPELFASEYDLGRFREAAMPAGVDVSGSAGGSVIEDFGTDTHPILSVRAGNTKFGIPKAIMQGNNSQIQVYGSDLMGKDHDALQDKMFIKVSIYMIYCDRIYDLLSSKTGRKIKIEHFIDPQSQQVVSKFVNMSERVIFNLEQYYALV